MTQIKICGLTNKEDVLFAAQYAAALGFIFYPASPRYVTPQKVCQIMEKIPESIVRVGVFVNEDIAQVKRIAAYCKLDFIQLHGDESVEYCHNFPPAMLIKALPLRSEIDLAEALHYNVAAILIDSRAGGLYGGTGQKANWDLALQIRSQRPLILAGGLNELNLREAVEEVAPPALDINSGVEVRPGVKDHKKIARLFDLVRSLDQPPNATPLIFKKREFHENTT